jgi:hypothetical protein
MAASGVTGVASFFSALLRRTGRNPLPLVLADSNIYRFRDAGRPCVKVAWDEPDALVIACLILFRFKYGRMTRLSCPASVF